MICKCKGQRCTCRFEGGFSVEVSGNGSDRQPYLADFIPWELVGVTNSSAEVNITGSGTIGDPWVITVISAGSTTTTTVFTASGSYTPPPSATVVHVTVIGGGGGGGRGGSRTVAAGASGGGGGAMSTGWFIVEDLPEAIEVQVGQGGVGAEADGPTTVGGNGGASYFGDFLRADGGTGGQSQSGNTPPATSITPGGTAPEGGPGGAGSYREGGGSTAAVPATSHHQIHAPTGGGLGEGNITGETFGGVLEPSRALAGRGGRGGYHFSLSLLQRGNDGGLYGGGGGGGSISDTGPVGFSDGGSGAQGVVIVTAW